MRALCTSKRCWHYDVHFASSRREQPHSLQVGVKASRLAWNASMELLVRRGRPHKEEVRRLKRAPISKTNDSLSNEMHFSPSKHKCGRKASIGRRWCASKRSATEADSAVSPPAKERHTDKWQEWLALATSLYPVYVGLGTIIAVARPSSFAWFCAGGPTLYSAALGVIMLSMGLTIRWQDLQDLVFGQPAAIAFGFAAQYLVMPLLGLLVSRALGLAPPLAAGLILMSCCPGGTASNVVTLIGYGDVPLSVMMTICTTFGAVLMTPLLTQLLAGTLVPIDAAGLGLSTLQVVLLPVLLGMTCKNYFPKAVEAVLPFAPLTAVLTSSLLASSVFSVQVPLLFPPPVAEGTAPLASSAAPALGQVALAVLLVHSAGFALGYVVAYLARFKEAQRRAISIEVGMQNASLGVVLATNHFASPLTPLPCAISAIVMNIMGSGLAALWRLQGPLPEEHSAARKAPTET